MSKFSKDSQPPEGRRCIFSYTGSPSEVRFALRRAAVDEIMHQPPDWPGDKMSADEINNRTINYILLLEAAKNQGKWQNFLRSLPDGEGSHDLRVRAELLGLPPDAYESDFRPN
jgi:hypothetical protein